MTLGPLHIAYREYWRNDRVRLASLTVKVRTVLLLRYVYMRCAFPVSRWRIGVAA